MPPEQLLHHNYRFMMLLQLQRRCKTTPVQICADVFPREMAGDGGHNPGINFVWAGMDIGHPLIMKHSKYKGGFKIPGC
jgi:hypothetical protein